MDVVQRVLLLMILFETGVLLVDMQRISQVLEALRLAYIDRKSVQVTGRRHLHKSCRTRDAFVNAWGSLSLSSFSFGWTSTFFTEFAKYLSTSPMKASLMRLNPFPGSVL